MLDLLAIGDIKMDTFVPVPHAAITCELQRTTCKMCIDYGTKTLVPHFLFAVAGSAPNVAVGLKKLGRSTGVLSTIGKDEVGKAALAFLREHGISTKHVELRADISSSHSVVLNFQGESTQLVSHTDVRYHIPARMSRTKFIHLSEMGAGYVDLYRELLEYVKKTHTRISINPGSVQIAERKKELFDLLAVTEILFLNRSEAAKLLEKSGSNMSELLDGLMALGPKTVVITDGQAGSYVADKRGRFRAEMFPGERVEATGAGDAFSTGFIGAVLHGKGPDAALCWGSVNAASVVGYVGPTKGLLSTLEIMQKLEELKTFTAEKM